MRKVLHSLGFKLIQIQYTYTESFGYLNLARNILLFLPDVKARMDTLRHWDQMYTSGFR